MAVIMIFLMFCSLVMFYLAVSFKDPSQAVNLHRLQLTHKKFIMLFLFSVLIGLPIDLFIGFINVDRPLLDGPFFLLRHFTFSIPIFLILLMGTIYVLRVRIRVGISMLGLVYGFYCMVLTLATHLKESGEWYGLVFLLGVIPSSLIGTGFGLYLSFQVKEETSETMNRKLIGFIHKSE
jgi:hypothetical protein